MQSTTAPGAAAFVRATVTRAARETAYLTIGGLTSCLAFTVWVVGLSVSLSLIVFIVGIPVAAGTAIAMRWTAELDRRNAAWLLGRPVRGRYRDLGRGLRGLLSSTLGDPQTWRDLVWLVLHSVIGFAFACIALGGVVLAAGIATLPAWFWTLPSDGPDFGLWRADTLFEAFLSIPLALPVAVATIGLVRVMAVVESGLAESLLGGDDEAVQPTATSTAAARQRRYDPHMGMSLHLALTALVWLLMALIWVGSGGGYFWPAWVWLSTGVVFGLHLVIHRALRHHRSAARRSACTLSSTG